jgi:hypothetical protein
MKETAMQSIGDTPMLETPQPHRLPVPRQTAICLVSYGFAVSVGAQAGCGNNSDDPRVDTPQNDETPLLDPLSLIQRK